MTAEHRLVWEQHRGPVPKGWVVHFLNGDTNDLRLENLAALPREGPPHKITPPYRERIQILEKLLQQQEKN